MTERQFIDRLFYLLLAAVMATMYTAYWLYMVASENPLMPSYLRYEHANTIMATVAFIGMFAVAGALGLLAYYTHTRSAPVALTPPVAQDD